MKMDQEDRIKLAIVYGASGAGIVCWAQIIGTYPGCMEWYNVAVCIVAGIMHLITIRCVMSVLMHDKTKSTQS